MDWLVSAMDMNLWLYPRGLVANMLHLAEAKRASAVR